MENLQFEDLEIIELKRELEFIERHQNPTDEGLILTNDGMITVDDYRLSSQHKMYVTGIYNRKIKEQRKKQFILVNNES